MPGLPRSPSTARDYSTPLKAVSASQPSGMFPGCRARICQRISRTDEKHSQPRPLWSGQLSMGFRPAMRRRSKLRIVCGSIGLSELPSTRGALAQKACLRSGSAPQRCAQGPASELRFRDCCASTRQNVLAGWPVLQPLRAVCPWCISGLLRGSRISGTSFRAVIALLKPVWHICYEYNVPQ